VIVRPATGLLVVIEGIDGAGKTTLRAALAQALRARGREVVETKEPTEGPIGKEIRRIAKEGRGTISAEEEFALFHEDRREHVKSVVLPALERGAIVLQDRSYFSSVAYQGERGLDRARLFERSKEIAPEPDVLLVCDLPAEVSLARLRSRGLAIDDFESLDHLRRVREIFVNLPGITLIDAMQPPEDMARAALEAVLSRLGEGAR
jgi:dTMP kinase